MIQFQSENVENINLAKEEQFQQPINKDGSTKNSEINSFNVKAGGKIFSINSPKLNQYSEQETKYLMDAVHEIKISEENHFKNEESSLKTITDISGGDLPPKLTPGVINNPYQKGPTTVKGCIKTSLLAKHRSRIKGSGKKHSKKLKSSNYEFVKSNDKNNLRNRKRRRLFSVRSKSSLGHRRNPQSHIKPKSSSISTRSQLHSSMRSSGINEDGLSYNHDLLPEKVRISERTSSDRRKPPTIRSQEDQQCC